MNKAKLFFIVLILSVNVTAQFKSQIKIGRLKYSGGGDWYNDPSAEVNLLNFAKKNVGLDVDARYEFVEILSEKIFDYPILFLTGHGNIFFSTTEALRLREYLERGGFIYADDDYGMDASFRREVKKIFPELELQEIPFNHGIFSAFYKFPNGVPKTHEHDNKQPKSFGLFLENRLALLYTYESNPSDGWADAEIHNDTEEKRTEALKFGTNILVWALTK